MSIGYCCMLVGVPGMQLRTCNAKNATPDRLRELIGHNLEVLGRMLQYNKAQGIRVFRVSSDIIPFGSSPVNRLDWAAEFQRELAAVGAYARREGMRLSMHPGQYTVINSPNPDVVARAVEDLRYHTAFLDALGLDGSHKIVLHIGGVYGDKPAAIERFCAQYRQLDQAVRRRLVVENDDKLFSAQEVLEIARAEGMPMVFDNLHNAICQSPVRRTEAEWVQAARATWGPADGRQKVHYSQQAAPGKPGAHSATISIRPFLQYFAACSRPDLDIMLEVKDKNLSAIKCVNCTEGGTIARLERDWARYKYLVLEHDAAAYNAIRELLKDKRGYPAAALYAHVEAALDKEPTAGSRANAAQHVWGYYKRQATAGEAASFQKALADGRQKSFLRRMQKKYPQPYLEDSYYLNI